MIKHIMKDPKDLDSLSDEQADLTRRLDSGGEKTRTNLIMFAASIVLRVDDVALGGGLSVAEIQRAAYEAHALNASQPSAANRFVAAGLWSLVTYLQAGIMLAREGVKEPEIIAHYGKLGIPVPTDDP